MNDSGLSQRPAHIGVYWTMLLPERQVGKANEATTADSNAQETVIAREAISGRDARIALDTGLVGS